MNQQEFCARIYPLFDAGDFQGFIDEYDRNLELLGGIECCDDDIHVIAHGHRVLRWNALEQISTRDVLAADIKRFLATQSHSQYVMQLVCGLIEDQSMERLLPLLEQNSPTPLRILKAMHYRLALQHNAITEALAVKAEFDALPEGVDERGVRILLSDVRFREEHIVSVSLNRLPENNHYLNIVARHDGHEIEVEMPLPENNSLCESGSATLTQDGVTTDIHLQARACEPFLLLSPYGYRYQSEAITIIINNLRLLTGE